MDALFNDQGRVLATTMSGECVDQELASGKGLGFDDLTTAPGTVSTPGVQAAITANRFAQAVPRMPVLLYHSVADALVPTAGADQLAAAYCAGGATLQYQKYPQTDHVQVAVFAIGTVLGFLDARFAGVRPASTC